MITREAEYERLLAIFRKLDRLYQPHNREKTPYGLLDSPMSLITQTRQAINSALLVEENQETIGQFQEVVESQSWAKRLG